MLGRVLRVLAIELLGLMSLNCEAGGQAPQPLPVTAQPAPRLEGGRWNAGCLWRRSA